MKKQLLLFVMMLLPMVASADDSGTCGDNVTWTFVESTGTLTIEGSGRMENYYFSVPWDYYRDKILSVFIRDGVTRIGSYAFHYCSSLTSIEIPNSVTSIQAFAFIGCSGLTSVTIGNGVKSIGDFAFQDCSSLTSVTIGNSVTSIGFWAFCQCSSLTSVTIGNGVKSIGEGAFRSCESLTSVTIPYSVTSIGDSAFYDCPSLTSVTVEWPTPVVINSTTFANRKNAILYVPKDCKTAYQAAIWWKEFKKIVETETPASDISQLANTNAVKKEEWYTIDGVKLSVKPTQKGIYIHNGKKEIIK